MHAQGDIGSAGAPLEARPRNLSTSAAAHALSPWERQVTSPFSLRHNGTVRSSTTQLRSVVCTIVSECDEGLCVPVHLMISSEHTRHDSVIANNSNEDRISALCHTASLRTGVLRFFRRHSATSHGNFPHNVVRNCALRRTPNTDNHSTRCFTPYPCHDTGSIHRACDTDQLHAKTKRACSGTLDTVSALLTSDSRGRAHSRWRW